MSDEEDNIDVEKWESFKGVLHLLPKKLQN